MTDNISIIAHAEAQFSREFTNADIRKLVKQETQLSVRRLDNFTLTAMNAVYRLLNGKTLKGAIGLYSSAEYFSLELLQSTISSQSQGLPVRPLDFIATVGNAANFYLAKEFRLLGPNNFIGASELAFKKLAFLAKSDFELELISHAVLVVWHEEETRRICNAYLLCKSGGSCNNEVELGDIENHSLNSPALIKWTK